MFPSLPSKELSLAIVGMSGKCLVFIRFWQFLQVSGLVWWLWQLPTLNFEGCQASPFLPGESPQNRHFPNLVCFPLFLPYSLHCHPKNSREKAPWEKGGPLDTSCACKYTAKKRLASIAKTARCLKQLQLAFPAKGFQANTVKLGMIRNGFWKGQARYRNVEAVSWNYSKR